jgi:hypothetical protein
MPSILGGGDTGDEEERAIGGGDMVARAREGNKAEMSLPL